MSLNELLKIKVRTNPDSLFHLLVKAALVSIVAIVILSGYGFYRVFSSFVIKSAEADSVIQCKELLAEQREFIFVEKPGKPVELGLQGGDSASLASFDASLRTLLAPFHIIKVKIYNTDKRIVYSTNRPLIGKVDEHNLRLNNALAGNVDAKMVTKDTASDLADEPLRDVDVVETYVPILSPDRTVLGSFEIYMNMTGYRQQIRQGVMLATTIMAIVLGSVFAVTYLLIHGGIAQLKEVQSRLELAAITDSLTGVYNSGYLMERGAIEFERVQRTNHPLGCIMMDLDHFKQVNDTRGHVAGDAVLHCVAERLQSVVRPYDILGRYGGEEFMLLLPDTTLEQSLAAAERICALVQNTPVTLEEDSVPVTISLGVACVTTDDRAFNDLINRADKGLYKAKADGRNRVAWVAPAGKSMGS